MKPIPAYAPLWYFGNGTNLGNETEVGITEHTGKTGDLELASTRKRAPGRTPKGKLACWCGRVSIPPEPEWWILFSSRVVRPTGWFFARVAPKVTEGVALVVDGVSRTTLREPGR